MNGLLTSKHPVSLSQVKVLSLLPLVDPKIVIPPPSAVVSDALEVDPIPMFLSSTMRVSLSIVVVVPWTVRLPETVQLPVILPDKFPSKVEKVAIWPLPVIPVELIITLEPTVAEVITAVPTVPTPLTFYPVVTPVILAPLLISMG